MRVLRLICTDSLSLTQSHSGSDTYASLTHARSRFIQSHLDLFRFPGSHPDSLSLTQIHSISLRFALSHSDSCDLTQIRSSPSNFNQIHSDSQNFIQSHTDSLYLVQIDSDPFSHSHTRVHSDSHSFTPDSFYPPQTQPDAQRFTQTHSD